MVSAANRFSNPFLIAMFERLPRNVGSSRFMLLGGFAGQLLFRFHPVLHIPTFLPPSLFIQFVGPPGNALVIPSGPRYLKRRIGLYILPSTFGCAGR